jgi:hypothetical protein
MTFHNNNRIKQFYRNFKLGTLRYNISSFYLGYPLELWHTLSKTFSVSHQPLSKFVIFTSGRSGSTLLVDLINSNPDVYCDGELLKRRVAFPYALVKKFEKNATQNVYGFKLLSYQLLNVQTGIKDKKSLMDKLVYEENYKLIYLDRENKAKQALSIIYGFYRGKWHNENGKSNNKTAAFELDPTVFLKFLTELDILEKFEKSIIANYPHLYLSYEKDLRSEENRISTMKRVYDFLEVPYVESNTTLNKVTPSELSSMISNKTDVIDFLKNTPYSHYIPTLERM